MSRFRTTLLFGLGADMAQYFLLFSAGFPVPQAPFPLSHRNSKSCRTLCAQSSLRRSGVSSVSRTEAYVLGRGGQEGSGRRVLRGGRNPWGVSCLSAENWVKMSAPSASAPHPARPHGRLARKRRRRRKGSTRSSYTPGREHGGDSTFRVCLPFRPCRGGSSQPPVPVWG